MGAEATAQKEVSHAIEETQSGVQGPLYVGRFGVVLLRLPDGSEPMFTTPDAREFSHSVSEKLRKALDVDPRVVKVYIERAIKTVDNARTHTYWEFNSEAEDFGEFIDRFEVLRLNEPIVFRVRVPIKNQPIYRGIDDVPSDEYLVVWDGVSVLVQWNQDVTEATASGGHIVFDVLEAAAGEAGYAAEVVACSAECHHKFVHADVVTFDGDTHPDKFVISGETPVGVGVITPFNREKDDLSNLLRTYHEISYAVDIYSQVRDSVDSIYSMETKARSDSAKLMLIEYSRASSRQFPNPRSVVDAWKLRNFRGESRKLLSGLWLAMNYVESFEREWRRSSVRFKSVLEENGLEKLTPIFDIGEEEIEALDLSLIRENLQDSSSRMDSRMIFFATLAGAGAALGGAALSGGV
ncbi:hypothetical protein RCG67_10170 [Kocuria sp. CPCC 205292]|uniref:hypothetical protein n=1 Tax=Kocuria cellulosilytica TaxID=3071451 RepID=UPI0034D5AC47